MWMRTRTGSDVLRVAPGERGAAPTIAAALRAAAAGQTVVVSPGVYHEALLIDREIRLIAEHGPGSVWLAGAEPLRVTASAALADLILTGDEPGAPVLAVAGGAP